MRRARGDGCLACARRGRRTAALLAATLCVAGLWGTGLCAAPPPAAAGSGVTTRPAPDPDAGGRLHVFAGIEPVAFLVERVAGPRADVEVLVGAGRDPHTYDPEPSQLARLATSDLYVGVGLPLEASVVARVKAQNPGLSVIDASEGIPRRAARDGHNGRADPHVWMDPRLAKAMAARIRTALAAADPPHAGEYRRNLDQLGRDLDSLHAELARALSPLHGESFYVFHPAFGYFADAYGLRQVAVEAGGKEPGPRALATLIDGARAEGVRVIFVQPQFSRLSAEAIAREIGGAVVPIDALARDYIANLRSVARAVAEALRAAGPARG